MGNTNDSYSLVLADFVNMIEQAGIETLESVGQSAASIAEYMAERANHLAPLVGEKGFGQAVSVEADSVALRAGLAAVATGDAADARLRGLFEGAIRLGARALRLVAGDLGSAA